MTKPSQDPTSVGVESPLHHALVVIERRLLEDPGLSTEALLADFPDFREPLSLAIPTLRDLVQQGGNRSRDVVGDFLLGDVIGQGGMGEVRRALQVSLSRVVALKLLPTAAAGCPRRLQRFYVEAQAAARLHHPNVVPIHAVGSANGVHYYAMQLIEGRTLAEIAQEYRDRGTLPPAQQVAEWVRQAALGVHHAHEQGVTHRDLKPSNLLLDQKGTVWVSDFGLAHLRGDPALTKPGELIGTLSYLPPEQIAGQGNPGDPRRDVYSLGATLYELITLTPPHEGDSEASLLLEILANEPVKPRRRNPAVPEDLETVVLKAVARRPADRYPTALEFAQDLERFLAGQPVRGRRLGVFRRGLRLAARQQRRLLAAVLILVVGAALGTVAAVFVARNFGPAPVIPEPASVRALVEARDRLQQRLDGAGGDDPKLRLEVARACRLLMETYDELGRHREADDAATRAAGLLHENQPEHFEKLKWLCTEHGARLLEVNRVAEAERWLSRAFDLAGRGGDRAARARAGGKLAQALACIGRPAAAAPVVATVVADNRALAAAALPGPALQGVFSDLTDSLELQAEIQRQAGDLTAAERAAREALGLLEQRPDPAAWWRARQGRFLHLLASVLLDAGRAQDAEAVLDRLEAAVQGLERDFPQSRAHRALLAEHHEARARWHLLAGRRGQAWEAAAREAAVLEAMSAAGQGGPEVWHALARALLLPPNTSPTQVERAREFAQRAVDANPACCLYHRTLGVARYRQGAWDDAVTELEAAACRPFGDAEALFSLALAQRAAGRAAWKDVLAEAERAYTRTPRKAELVMLRDEARR